MSEKYTVNDKLVQDSLRAISFSNSISNIELILVGGMASQLHLRKDYGDFLRPTHDVDTVPSRPIVSHDFKGSLREHMFAFLQNEGYKTTNGKKTRYGFELIINDQNDIFFIHLNKYPKSIYEKNKKTKDREAENAVEFEISSAENIKYSNRVRAFRVEDIITNKIIRLKKLESHRVMGPSERENFNILKMERFDNLANINFNDYLVKLIEERAEMQKIAYDTEKFNNKIGTYKIRKDLYDISLLAKGVVDKKLTFDQQYYKNALSDIKFFN